MKGFYTKVLTFTIIFTIIGMFVVFPGPASAKKGKKKLTDDEITAITATVDKLTKKVYAAGLFSPEDNDKLIDTKIKVDGAYESSPTSLDFPQLYYKLGYIYKQREYKDEAVECYTTILENFADSPYALRAGNELKKMGVKIQSPGDASAGK